MWRRFENWSGRAARRCVGAAPRAGRAAPFAAAKWAAAGVLALLAACTSAGPVVQSEGAPDRLTVTVAASGSRMAWAHAYTAAVSEARHYCAGRGQDALIQVSGTDGAGDDRQSATVRFTCSRA